MPFTLYTYFRSSASYRVRIVLGLKGLEYDAISLHLQKGEQQKEEYLAKNPQGFVPALAVDNTILSQSLAIIEYLDQVHPEPALIPNNTISAARVRALSQLIACDIHPLNNLRVLKYLRSEMGAGEDDVNMWYRHWVDEGFAALERILQEDHKREKLFMFGNQITMADVCLVPQVYNARRFDVDMTKYPLISEIDMHLNSIPAFSDAVPENQFDAS